MVRHRFRLTGVLIRRPRTHKMVGRAALCVLAASFVLYWGSPAAGEVTDGLLDLLQPGLPRDTEFGGDPFRAPVGDDRGWWRRGMVDTGRGVRWQWFEYHPITKRLTEDGGEARFRELEFAVGHRAGRLRSVLHVTHQELHASINPSPDNYTVSTRGNQLALTLRLATNDGRWVLQGTAPLARDSGTVRQAPLGIGLRFRSADKLDLEVSWVSSQLDYHIDFGIADDRVATGLNLDRHQVAVAWNWRITSTLALAGRAAHSDLESIEPVTDAYRYESQPQGRADALLVVGTFRSGDRWTLALRGTYDELDVAGEAFWGGQRFATLSYVRGDVASALVAARYNTSLSTALVADVQVSRLHGEGRLSVRSWPFTDTLIDLLGITSVGKTWIDSDCQRYHCGVQNRTTTRRLEAGVAWFNIFPDATLREVHSGPFGIGAETTRHDLATDHVQLGAVILGAEFRWARWHLGVDLYQFVIARAHENLPSGSEEPPGMPPPPAPESEKGGWFGGTYARVQGGIGF